MDIAESSVPGYGIESLEFYVQNPDFYYTLTEGYPSTYRSWINISPAGKYKDGNVVFVSEDPNIVKVEAGTAAGTTSLWFIASPVSAGETYIYAQTADGAVKSRKLKIIVDPNPMKKYQKNVSSDADSNITSK